MDIIKNPTEKIKHTKPIAVALGNFDGVHLGHQKLISQCVEESRENGWDPCVVTFEPHPSLVVNSGRNLKLINTPEQKFRLIERLGVKTIYLLKFDLEFAATSPEDFVRYYLVELLGIRKVFVGFNYAFGCKGKGNPGLLKELGEAWGFAASIIEPVVIAGEIVSSSLIRDKMRKGHIQGAAQMLGYWPALEGTVVSGHKRGRHLGFPTANLQIKEHILLPAYGVYAALVQWKGHLLQAAVNIGVKPTFGATEPSVEVHILDYTGNIYAEELMVQIIAMVRPEKVFNQAADLQEQIQQDIQVVRRELAGKKYFCE